MAFDSDLVILEFTLTDSGGERENDVEKRNVLCRRIIRSAEEKVNRERCKEPSTFLEAVRG